MYKKISILVVTLLMLVASPSMGAYAASSGAGSTDPDVPAYEQAVLGRFIDNNGVVQNMTALCIQRAARPEVREFCKQELINAAKDLGTLKGYLTAWYGNSAYMPKMNTDATHVINQLQNASADQFEALWLDAMIWAQTDAFSAAKTYLTREMDDGNKECPLGAHSHGYQFDPANRPELEAFASYLVAHASATRSQMQNWSCTWYNSNCTDTERGFVPRSTYSENR